MRDCVFCKIAREDKENQVEDIVHSLDGIVVVITPLNPVVPGHKLFIHELHTNDASEDAQVFADVAWAASVYASKNKIESFNLITSKGSVATQTVKHLHLHLVPRTENDGLKLPWSDQ